MNIRSMMLQYHNSDLRARFKMALGIFLVVEALFIITCSLIALFLFFKMPYLIARYISFEIPLFVYLAAVIIAEQLWVLTAVFLLSISSAGLVIGFTSLMAVNFMLYSKNVLMVRLNFLTRHSVRYVIKRDTRLRKKYNSVLIIMIIVLAAVLLTKMFSPFEVLVMAFLMVLVYVIAIYMEAYYSDWKYFRDNHKSSRVFYSRRSSFVSLVDVILGVLLLVLALRGGFYVMLSAIRKICTNFSNLAAQIKDTNLALYVADFFNGIGQSKTLDEIYPKPNAFAFDAHVENWVRSLDKNIDLFRDYFYTGLLWIFILVIILELIVPMFLHDLNRSKSLAIKKLVSIIAVSVLTTIVVPWFLSLLFQLPAPAVNISVLFAGIAVTIYASWIYTK